jgi:hypothetical protein
MKRIGICGFMGIILVLCLGASSWAYNLELIYDSNANVADAYATDWTYYDIPGQVPGSGTVTQSATVGGSPPAGSGVGTTRPVVVLTDHVDNSQSIINTAATAYWYGYGQGFGSSNMGFKIIPGPGEASQVMATLGFRVIGTLNIQQVPDDYGYNFLILDYASSLVKPGPTALSIASNYQYWDTTLNSDPYTSGGEITVPLNANELYVFKSHLQVDASGYLNDSENSINFAGFVTIKDIQAVPLPPGIVLVGSGLIGLGIFALRRRD